ncbi:O-methyltransferase [Ktedonobacter sp. SOSP1-52]|uniref:O-methyltransferase n=1 Tax=Ktedonobacter sp. SOSP1-52 TaxID=2778366 RepID=UPI001915C836|nr:class I SAM-dependent methyltransferase [Ktedonobacter sp. SOSP1-52]GHO62286.1 O-methyltransferase [Ktedonobacter sp. SOSP1-52]
MSNIDVQAFLEELYAQGRANDAHVQERGQKMLNLEPETAQFLHILLRSTQRKHILEIGTSNGYSTTWLAWAASEHGGRVVSIDRDPHKHELAATNLRQAGLRELVDLKCGDATEIIANLSGPLDCVFFDADRYSAPAQVGLLLPKLAPDVFLLADNVISHPDEITGYLKTLDELPQFEKLVIPIGKGLSVAYRSA